MATYTEEDLSKIRSAIASGLRRVTFADGRSTEYQSLDHMLAAEKVIAAQVGMAAEATSGLVRRHVPYYKSGV